MSVLQGVCLIVFVGFLFFLPTLRFKFASDDIPAWRGAPKPKNAWHRIWIQLAGRGHYTEAEAHFITIVLHTLTCVFIYLGLGPTPVSLLAAFLFMLNPRNNQGSIWISGRQGYLMPTLCLMAAISIPILSPVALWLATRQATAFIAPLGLLGSPYWLILVSLPIAWWINGRRVRSQVGSKMGLESVADDTMMDPTKLILGVKTFGYYFFMCLIPHQLAFYHSFMQSGAGAGNDLMRKKAYALDRVFWFGLAVIVAFLVASVVHWSPITWGVYWFLVCVLPYLNMVRVQQEISERYVYCANVGLMFALAYVLVHFPMLAAIVLTAYAVRLFYFMPAYTDDFWLVEYAVIEDSASWFAWHMRGMNRWDRGSVMEALSMWTMARMLSPHEFKVLFNIGVALKRLQKNAEGAKFIELAKKYVVKGQEAHVEALCRELNNGKYPLQT